MTRGPRQSGERRLQRREHGDGDRDAEHQARRLGESFETSSQHDLLSAEAEYARSHAL
jgi:hypothetical protein